jgi:dTMP kinase
MTRAPFLVFEGVEGSGKTTQATRLGRHLRDLGYNHLLTKEPGGTALGERIRAILLDPSEEGMDPLSELLLYAASRRQHVVDLIQPSVDRGIIVICDRFTDATLAYQGYGRLLDIDLLRQLNDWVTGGLAPDLTVILDLPEEEGLNRAKERNLERDLHLESRLEGEDLRFHRRVREGYLALAEETPERYAVVSATGSVDEVFERILAVLAERMPGMLTPVEGNDSTRS